MRHMIWLVVVCLALLVALTVVPGMSAVGEKPSRYEDPGCTFEDEYHGCHDSGSLTLCWQDATYSRWGMPGEIPLEMSVYALAKCLYVHIWPQRCEDEDTEIGSGEVTAEAECVIFQSFSGDCFRYQCDYSCTER